MDEMILEGFLFGLGREGDGMFYMARWVGGGCRAADSRLAKSCGVFEAKGDAIYVTPYLPKLIKTR